MHSARVAPALPARLLVFALAASMAPAQAPPPVPPVVAGLAAPGLDARVRGLVLLGELGCVACHRQAPEGALVEDRAGPDLTQVGGRVRADYLARFLADPHRVEPGTPMPDLLRDLGPRERLGAAETLAQYLRSLGGAASADEAFAPEAAARGRELFHAIGCAVCHAPRDAHGAELDLAGSVPLGRLEAKYHRASLRAFLLAPHEARPAMRMPDLRLTPAEAHDLSHYLVPAAPEVEATPLVADRVAEGEARFAALGCAQCHATPRPAPRAPAVPALRDLDPARGCLSGATGAWPFYPLSDAQRADIRTALATQADDLGDEARIRQRLAARSCVACHERADWGGVAEARSAFFTTSDETIGHDGRVPPPLTGVGAKLQPAWLRDAIAFGAAERPYLRTRMPGFGAACGEELAGLLAGTDHLPAVATAPLPGPRKEAEAITEIGRELVGDRGMNCIACHAFAGERAGAMGAIDLVHSTGARLRPEWFHHFMRAPAQFRPGTLMPQFFVGGVSVRPELADGDPARQLDAMWHYLAGGRNVRKPNGMRPPPIELVVGDEAVLLRRSVQHTGKRGISVGYPGGVNLTFDAETLAVNQVWWGQFVDAAPVWHAQGSGEARILGKARATLPKGPAFAALPSPTAPWPEGSRRELGHRFLGYDLDARQRPSFRYVGEGVTITDAPREVAGAAGALPALRRTLTLVGEGDATLCFLAARDARLDDLGGGSYRVGRALRLRVSPTTGTVHAAGEARELRVAVALRAGRAELVLEYTWQEEGK